MCQKWREINTTKDSVHLDEDLTHNHFKRPERYNTHWYSQKILTNPNTSSRTQMSKEEAVRYSEDIPYTEKFHTKNEEICIENDKETTMFE